MLVTCHTEGCPNAEQTIDLSEILVDDDGARIDVSVVVCGVCQQVISDVSAVEPYDTAPPLDA